MASIKEAYDSTMKEAFTGIKVFTWAFAIAYTIIQFKNMSSSTLPLDFIFTNWAVILVLFLLLGFVVTLARKVVSKAPFVVPGLNIIEMAINAVLALIATAPYAILGYAIYYSCGQITLPGEIIDPTFHILVLLFAISLPLTAICLLVRRMNIMDAYNIKKFLYGFFLVFLDYSFFGIRALIVIGAIYAFFVYLFSLFIGFDNNFWLYIVSIGIMFVVILYANAIAQISDDIYTFPEKEELKKKEDALVQNIIAQQQSIKDER